MKAIILAAGTGSRMLPLTKDTHKCLLKINNEPIIRNQINHLNSAGISDINLVGGYKFDLIKDYLKDEVEYSFNPFYETTNSVVSLWLAVQNIDSDILIINSDVVFDDELVKQMCNVDSEISVAISKNWSDERGYKAQIINDFVVDMSMNIEEDKIGGEYAGMIFVKQNQLQKLKNKCDKLMIEKKFNIWFEDMIVDLIKDGAKAKSVEVDSEKWYELDTVEELEYARNKFSKAGTGC